MSQSKYNEGVSKKVVVPEGFEKCLVDFTVDVLKSKPSNIYEHAVKYFTQKLQCMEIKDSNESSK